MKILSHHKLGVYANTTFEEKWYERVNAGWFGLKMATAGYFHGFP